MRRLLVSTLIAALSLPPSLMAEPAAVQERLHVLYDPQSREVVRRDVRVQAVHPDLSLDFQWEPAQGNWPGIDGEGFADGPGRVVWRIEGLASYDPRAVHHAFEGTLKAGRFEGEGSLTYRDGAFREGTWRAGLLHGEGRSRDAEGNLYEGAFAEGEPSGHGTWRGRDGFVYEGTFEAGKRHGAGRITEPGGLAYDVGYDMGRLVRSERPENAADPLIGGLLPAQSGDSASRMAMNIGIDQRVSEQQSIQYMAAANNGNFYIYTRDESLQSMWNGTGDIGSFNYPLMENGDSDWDETRAFVVMDLASTAGTRERLNSLDLVVARSVPHLQPILRVEQHAGCVGFRPTFSLHNHGDGAVTSAQAQVRFVDPNFYNPAVPVGQEPGTGWFTLPVNAFSDGTDVSVRDVLIQAGVDVATLEGRRFSCPSADMMEQCKQQTKASVNFGLIAPYVEGYNGLGTKMQGQLTYTWTDALGAQKSSTQTFDARLQLLKIETPSPMAECGGGGGYATEAPQFQHIELPVNATDYKVNVPFRGNPNIQRLVSGLALWSRKSAYHEMRIEASFADGSKRLSPTLQLFFLHPHSSTFRSTARPPSCYLTEEYGSC